MSELRRMVFGGRWCPHVKENRRTCVYKEKERYWTIIISPTKNYIFIITVYESNYSDIRMFKSFEEGWYLSKRKTKGERK